MPGDVSEASEPLRYDAQAKVAPFACTGMAGMAGALVLDCEADRRERLLERCAKPLRRIRRCSRSHRDQPETVLRSSTPSAGIAALGEDTARRDTQSAWAKMKTAVASVSPKRLKFTQVRSLA